MRIVGVCLLGLGLGVFETSMGARGLSAPPAAPAGAETTPQDNRQGQGARVGFEWWNDAGVRRDLKLSDESAKKIDNIYQARVREAQPWADKYLAERKKLEEMSRERTATQTQYSLQVSTVEGLRSRINETRIVMLYKMSLELSPEQFAKLQQILEARMRANMNSGRGAPAGR